MIISIVLTLLLFRNYRTKGTGRVNKREPMRKEFIVILLFCIPYKYGQALLSRDTSLDVSLKNLNYNDYQMIKQLRII